MLSSTPASLHAGCNEDDDDVRQHHIRLKVIINIGHGLPWRVAGVLDTGAPWTEVSDKFLHHAGLIDELPDDEPLPAGLQTRRYGKTVLPEVEVCGQRLSNIDYDRAVLEVG